MAFPQKDCLDKITGEEFFTSQSFTGICLDENNTPVGLYILHPNTVGRCGHICNCSYAVSKTLRGKGIGKALVTHSLKKGRELGFEILQFNAVVATNTDALKLYESLGFTRLGVIPKGFKTDKGYEDIIPHYITL